MKQVIQHREKYILISTLPVDQQDCLITHTISYKEEEERINRVLQNKKQNPNDAVNIVCYGKNCNDPLIYKKYEQLISLGLSSVYVYSGGLYEWLMLQDIYGFDEFPTTRKELDFIKYMSPSALGI